MPDASIHSPACRGASGLVVTALLLASLAGLINWVYTRSLLERQLYQSLQSRTNRNFVLESASWGEALETYPGVWPPLYPMALRAASEAGVPMDRVNQVLFYASLAWVFWWVRSRIREIHWGFPLLLLSLATFNYEVMSQLVPENLFAPLSFLVFAAMMRYSVRPSWVAVGALTAVCAAACATKYIGLFWFLPLGTLQILLAGPAQYRTRVLHWSAFAVMSVLPVGVWMGYQYDKTGFLTGIDRFQPKAAAAGNEDLVTLGANVWLTGKSVALDFLSVSHTADHTTVNHRYEPDWALYVFAALIPAILIANRKQMRRLVGAARDWVRAAWRNPRQELRHSRSSHLWVLGELVAVYGIVLVVLWTVGNNDPIYSRFVYPSYPFLVLLGFAAYGRARAGGELDRWGRLAVWAFYGLLLFVHVHKTVVLQHVVHTQPWS